MLIYILSTILLLWISRRWAVWVGTSGFVDATAKTLVICLSLILLLLTTVGFISIHPYFLLAVIAFLAAANEVVFRKGLRDFCRNAGSPRGTRPRGERLAEGILLAALCLLLGLFFLVGLFLPPRSADEQYHVQFPYSCVQQGRVSLSLFGIPPSTDFIAALPDTARTYPKGFESIALWQILFTRSLRLIEVTSFWFFLAALSGFFSLMRRAGIGTVSALFGLLFVAAIPMNLMQLTSIYSDLAMASMAILAIVFLVQALEGESSREWLCFGLAIAWLPAIKFNGVFFWILFAVAAFVGLLATRASKREWLRAALFVILPALALSSIWYLSNIRYYGNPVAPYQIAIFGKVLIPGQEGLPIHHFLVTPERFEHPWRALWTTFLEPILNTDIGTAEGGFGAHFFIIGLPSIALFPLFLFIDRSLKAKPLLLAFVLMALLVILQPYRWTSRYVLILSFLGGLGFAITLHAVPRWKKTLPAVAFALAVLGSFFFWGPYLPHRYYRPDVWRYFLKTGDKKSFYFRQHPHNFTWANATLEYAAKNSGPVRCLFLHSLPLPQNQDWQFEFHPYSGKEIDALDEQIRSYDIDLVFADLLTQGAMDSEEIQWLDAHHERFRRLWDTPLPEEFLHWPRPRQWIRVYEVRR